MYYSIYFKHIDKYNDKYRPEGYGKIFFKEDIGSALLAEFRNGLVDGFGILKIDGEIMVESEMKDFEGKDILPHGYGISKLNGVLYKGEFKDGLKDGIWTQVEDEGYYEGEFKEGKDMVLCIIMKMITELNMKAN